MTVPNEAQREHPTKVEVRLEWKPQDCWIGVFWRREVGWRFTQLDVWVCLLPMVPIHVRVFRRSR